MKAVVQKAYGPPAEVLEVRELEKPAPAADQVLVRVRAASVHADVWHVVTGLPYLLRLMGAGFSKPNVAIPGTDFAGVVEAVGKSVTSVKPGDEVFGESITSMQWVNGGTYAEYAAVPATCLALKPKNVTFEQAAAVPTSGYVVLHNMMGELAPRPNLHVLVNGAGGAVGSIALQYARACGSRVTAVDHTRKLELLRSLGADQVLDYTEGDVTLREDRYDLIFDVASTLTLARARRALTASGKYVLIGHDHFGKVGRRVLGSVPRVFGLIALTPFVSALPKPAFEGPKKSDALATLRELLETGKLTPVVAKTFPLEAAAEALACLAEGAALGRIVIRP